MEKLLSEEVKSGISKAKGFNEGKVSNDYIRDVTAEVEQALDNAHRDIGEIEIDFVPEDKVEDVEEKVEKVVSKVVSNLQKEAKKQIKAELSKIKV